MILLSGACALAGLMASAGARAQVPSLAGGDGLKVLSQKQLDSRLIQVSVSTATLPGPANIRILLPAGYSPSGAQRYPVLYLIHGTSGGAADWTTMGGAEQATAGLPLIVVMPDIALNDNGGGWCTNWVNGGRYGVPEWETFHIDQLIPWVDANLRTLATRDGRAIAGLSQGGFCSTSYAARHPDLFGIALSYSGAPDIAYDTEDAAGSTAIINATEVGLDGVPPNSMFGDRASDEVNWADHDPATLAENLRDTDLFLLTGNGMSGPLDSSPVNPGAMLIEGAVHQDTIDFHNRLNALEIPSFFDDYGPGTHSWPYWARDLKQTIGPVMQDFAHPPPAPQRVTYTTADSAYSIYGWQVSMHRTAREFSTLENADAESFAVSGSGSATVVTPPAYTPGQAYVLTVRSESRSADQPQRTTAAADAQGRLRVEVPLGPANPYQQYTAQAMATGTAVYTTTVAIARAGGGASTGVTVGGHCVSRRAMEIHVRAARRTRLTVLVNGRHHRFSRTARGAVRLSLAGRPVGTYRVTILVRPRHGPARRVTHIFHTCRPGRRRK